LPVMDTTEFKRASQAVWDAMAPGWDHRNAYFEERARPVTERMLERLAPARGEAILELAAGTGLVGFAAAALVGSGGRVIVSDFSKAMVEVAERHADELGLENVECRVLDAERLDLPDKAVDGVLCRWGYMLMADPAAALCRDAPGTASGRTPLLRRFRGAGPEPVGSAAVARPPGAWAHAATGGWCSGDPCARRPRSRPPALRGCWFLGPADRGGRVHVGL
jgi:SAM-dependent methyltransferase